MVEAIRHFHSFLLHRYFVVETDHISLRYIHDLRASTQGRLIRRSLLLQSYDFSIQYKQGTLNQPADALSRLNYPSPTNVPEDDVFLRDDIYFSTIEEDDES